jgi:hypothetical protein
MLRLKPFLLGAATVVVTILLLSMLHHRGAAGGDGALEGPRQELAVGFLPVT